MRAAIRGSTSSAARTGSRPSSARWDGGAAAVAFALYPTSLRELMAIADCGLVMPPKSTWFDPKLVDGLVTYPFF